ncbi:hypothetical protein ACFL29_01760 [Patescibacteria group bacterium]
MTIERKEKMAENKGKGGNKNQGIEDLLNKYRNELERALAQQVVVADCPCGDGLEKDVNGRPIPIGKYNIPKKCSVCKGKGKITFSRKEAE